MKIKLNSVLTSEPTGAGPATIAGFGGTCGNLIQIYQVQRMNARSVVREIALAMLLLGAAGCAGYRPAVMPGAGNIPADEETPRVVEVASQVRVVMNTGQTIKGEVVRLSADEIVLGKPGNYGFETCTIARDEIAELEVGHDGSLSGVATTTVTVVVLGALFLLGMFTLGGPWGGN